MGLKSLLLRPLTIPLVGRGIRTVVRPVLNIFMLHRFSSERLGTTHGHHASVLRERLAYLRREKYDLMDVRDVTAGDANGTNHRSGKPRIAFTLDDGYSDFVTEAMPVFAEFDCPVTVFLATGVVDRDCWYWYDQINFAFGQTRASSIRVSLDGSDVQRSWSDEGERYAVRGHLIERLKTVPEADRPHAIKQITDALNVNVPKLPTSEFETMTWDDVKRCAATGLVSFGPHSVTHPPLDTIDAEHSRHEINASWARLNEAGAGVVPIFCYPFGAYGAREVETLSKSGMIGAVTTEYRYADPQPFNRRHGDRRYTVARIAYEEAELPFLQAATGVERIKLGLRNGAKGWTSAGASPEIGARGSELI
jgi:peptidoglycan/xylan/chitin deacetylase (PgdA/CDA1 family)